MKVILQKDLKGTGKKEDIVEVSEGYARNYLFPKGLAVPANAENLNSINIRKGAQMHRKDMEKKAAQELAAELKDKTVTVYAKGGDNGKLFGSVTNKEVSEAIKKQLNLELDKKKIELPVIKNIGTFTAEAKVYADVSAEFNVVVKVKDA